MGDPPTTPSGERPIAAFDLDHTILHMLAANHVPDEAKELSEDVVTFEVNDVEYAISVRGGHDGALRSAAEEGRGYCGRHVQFDGRRDPHRVR